jgi:glycosyltransferase involved in cell wall biosynthesis
MNTPRNADNFPDVRIAVVHSSQMIAHIADVIAKIPGMVWRICVVDDGCHDSSGEFVAANINDQRVRIIHNTQNLGVGGAVMMGDHADIGYDIASVPRSTLNRRRFCALSNSSWAQR